MFRALAASLLLASLCSAQLFKELPSPGQSPVPLASVAVQGTILPVAVADFDQDGEVDLLGAGYRSQAVFWARGRGGGLFTDWLRTSWTGPFPTRGGRGDFDGDGAEDLVFVGYDSGIYQLRVQFGDGSGGFPRGQVLRSPVARFGLVRAGDVDGDGDPDLVFLAGGDLEVFFGDGFGRFTAVQTSFTSLRGPTNGAVLADVDGDGDLDFLPGPNLLENDGAGTFTDVTAARCPQGLCTATSVVADLNGDGRLDLAGGLAPELYLQDAAGVFRPRALPVTANLAWDMAALDPDHDGDLDLAVAAQGQAMVLLTNDGGGTFTEGPLLDAEEAYRLWVVDVERDGDLDLFVVHNQTGRLRCMLSVGQGLPVLASAATLGENLRRVPSVVGGDVDGDGDEDLVVSENCRPVLYRNDGSSRFVADPGAIPSDCVWQELALGDLDGDGDLDLLGGGSAFENDGAGRFTARGAVLIHEVYADLYDLDGDGDLDALGRRWHRNDGGFLFTPGEAAWFVTGTVDVARADFDGDGRVDFFSAVPGGQDRLFLGTGGAGVRDDTARALPQGASDTVNARAVDFDSDGDVDLLLGAFTSVFGGEDLLRTTLLANDGTGRFTDVTTQLLPFVPTGDRSAFTDFDGDGDRDLLVSGGTMFYFEQTGPGRFTPASGRWTRWQTGRVALVSDVDQDGDPDLVLEPHAVGPARVLANRQRQLHTPQLAGTGRSVLVDAYGQRGESAAVALASGLLPARQTTPLGSLGVDLSVSVALPIRTVQQADQRVSWRLRVPSDPVLSGVDLFLQGLWIGSGTPRLSNVVRLRIVE